MCIMVRGRFKNQTAPFRHSTGGHGVRHGVHADRPRQHARPVRASEAGGAPGAAPACRQVPACARAWCAALGELCGPLTSTPHARRFAKLEQSASSGEGERAARLCRAHPYVSECEALVALALCDNDEQRAERRLRSFAFLMRVRKVRDGEQRLRRGRGCRAMLERVVRADVVAGARRSASGSASLACRKTMWSPSTGARRAASPTTLVLLSLRSATSLTTRSASGAQQGACCGCSASIRPRRGRRRGRGGTD